MNNMADKKKKKAGYNDDDEPVEKVASHKEQDQADETSEDYKQGMREGRVEEDVNTEEGRQELADDDEIEEWEAGFSKGSQPDKHHQ